MRDTILLGLDVGVPGALLRAALGGGVVWAVHARGREGGLLLGLAALLAALFGLKAAAAVARRVFPLSPAVRAEMEGRRGLARVHDSYQWRKLAWVGLGMVAAAAGLEAASGWAARLGGACMLSGAAAEIVWRRKGLA